MEEFIGFGLVALFITGLVLAIRKVFTKKKDLSVSWEMCDFSNSFCAENPVRVVVFTLILNLQRFKIEISNHKLIKWFLII